MKEFLLKYGVFIILPIGLIFRLISLNQSLWLDEATTALVSKMSLTDIFTKFLPSDFHPPYYYLFMKEWVRFFGSSEISLRVPSVIFSLATVVFTYLIAKKLFDKKTATIASALAATSGLLIYYSQEARMYSLAAMLVILVVYLYLKNKWVPFAIFTALLGMTDYIALLVVPVFLIFAGKNIKKVVISLAPLLVVFAFWLPVFWKQVSGGLGVEGNPWWNILGTLSWKNLALIPVKFILGRIGFDNKIIYAIVTLLAVSLFGFLLYKSRKASKLIWGWLVIPVILGVLISIKIPILYYFRFLFCLPAFYILVAKGISGYKGARFGTLIAVLAAMNIFFSGYYLLNTKFHREDWRNMALAVGDNTIIYPSNSQKEALIYYGKGDNVVYYKNFRGKTSVIWLSRYVSNIFDPQDKARIYIENLGYNKAQELNLNGVEFWMYIK